MNVLFVADSIQPLLYNSYSYFLLNSLKKQPGIFRAVVCSYFSFFIISTPAVLLSSFISATFFWS